MFILSLNRVIDTASATTGWVDPQGVALALFLKQKNRNLVSLPVLAGFCLLGDRLKHLDCQLVKAADRYDAPLVSRSAY